MRSVEIQELDWSKKRKPETIKGLKVFISFVNAGNKRWSQKRIQEFVARLVDSKILLDLDKPRKTAKNKAQN